MSLINKLLVRFYSDLHLDKYQLGSLWYPPELETDKDTILVIAGDVWIATHFITFNDISRETRIIDPNKPRPIIDDRTWIQKVASRFKQVLIVLGNHDYWPAHHDLSILNGADKCNALLVDMGITNVKVLDRDVFETEGYIFVGATLWTDMSRFNPLVMTGMRRYMRYDGSISYATGPNGYWERFTSEKWVQTHCKHRDYIRIIAENNRDKKVIVITHHAPLETIIDPRYKFDSGNPYYVSDLSNLILDNPNIVTWAYGHIHHRKDTMMANCRLLNNAVGYPHETKDESCLPLRHEPIEFLIERKEAENE